MNNHSQLIERTIPLPLKERQFSGVRRNWRENLFLAHEIYVPHDVWGDFPIFVIINVIKKKKIQLSRGLLFHENDSPWVICQSITHFNSDGKISDSDTYRVSLSLGIKEIQSTTKYNLIDIEKFHSFCDERFILLVVVSTPIATRMLLTLHRCKGRLSRFLIFFVSLP